jgi:hypothetical protein
VQEGQARLTQQSEDLYRRYVEPLERDHQGEYVAVSESGEVILAPTLLEVMDRAEKRLLPGSFLFKVGEIAIDTWR